MTDYVRGQRSLSRLCRCHEMIHEKDCSGVVRIPHMAVRLDAADRRWIRELNEINQEYPWRP